MGDLVVFFFMAVAVGTGLWTMERHRQYFIDFRVRDIFKFRKDAVLYIVTQLSTAWCLIAIVLRIAWLYDDGWKHVDSRWIVLWCGWHAGHGIISTLLHITANVWIGHGAEQEIQKGRHG